YTIYKQALPVMEEISKENEVPFPPHDLLLSILKQQYQEKEKEFNEMASKMDIDKLSKID
ncbi:unnamed protein product, partial [marine sediment metagenome]